MTAAGLTTTYAEKRPLPPRFKYFGSHGLAKLPRERMKILFLTCQGGIAGSTNSIAFLARGLAMRGHDIFVGCRRDSLLCAMLDRTEVKVIPMRFSGKFDLDNIRHIRDLVRSNGIRIINAQSSEDRYTSILARWFYRLPVKVIHTRRQTPLSTGGFIQRLFYTKGTDKVIVISDELKKTFIRKGFRPDHLQVIYNGTPRERYDGIDAEKTEEIRRRLGIRPGERIIGCVSRKKKQDQLVRALPKVDPAIRVCFVGIEPGTYDRLAAELGVQDRIVYGGIVDPQAALHHYPLFAVNVLCSVTEGFGLVLVEAMAMGVPVVGTRAEGIIDVAENERNGLLYEDGDIDGLARQIRRILDDDALRKKLVGNGKMAAFDRFSMDRTVLNYESFFGGLLGDAATTG